VSVILILLSTLFFGAPAFAATPAIGAKAPDFTLSTPTGKAVHMSKEQHGHELVLVVLRGFPGYQCPYCVRQVHDFIDHASDFAAKNTRVLLVYPGPPADLDQHAKEFLEKQAELPSNVVLVTDPDYAMTNMYGLRWDAPHETAYPSTFVLDKKGTIVFEKISHTHGDRLSAQDALDHLSAN
jgi:peroxiredoxin